MRGDWGERKEGNACRKDPTFRLPPTYKRSVLSINQLSFFCAVAASKALPVKINPSAIPGKKWRRMFLL